MIRILNSYGKISSKSSFTKYTLCPDSDERWRELRLQIQEVVKPQAKKNKESQENSKPSLEGILVQMESLADKFGNLGKRR
jgi:hypothetical protein